MADDPVEKSDFEKLLFNFKAGKEYLEFWEQYFAEASMRPLEGGIRSKILGFTKKACASTAITLASL